VLVINDTEYTQSASLLKAQNTKEEWLICQRVVLPFKEDLDRLQKRDDRKFIKFNKGKCEVRHLQRNKPMHQHMLGAAQLESRLVEKDLEVLMDSESNMCQQCILPTKASSSILRCIRRSAARSSREVVLPYTQHW